MLRPFVGSLLVASAVLLAHADDCWTRDDADSRRNFRAIL